MLDRDPHLVAEGSDTTRGRGVRYGRPYSTLWTARIVSFFGDTIAQVALVLIAARQAHPAVAVSLLLLAQTLPRLLGPIAGLVIDRVDLRLLMLGCELGQGVLVAVIALLSLPFALVLVLVTAMSVLATLFLPAGQSALPALVAPEDLGDANTRLRLGFNVSHAVGPALAGLLLTISGASSILLIDALTFALSAALLSRLPVLRPAPAEDVSTSGLIAGAREGLSFLVHHVTARAVTIGLFLVTLFVALDNVGLVFLVERSLRANGTGYGFVLAGYGIGMVIGPLLLLRAGNRAAPVPSLLAGITAMGLGTLLCGLAPTLVIAIACQGIVGVGNGWQNIANDTLLQRTVPRPLLGRVFGIAYSAPYAALLITYAAGGVLLQLTTPRIIFVIAGAGTLAAAPLLWMLLFGPRRPTR
jgi:MFS family permease